MRHYSLHGYNRNNKDRRPEYSVWNHMIQHCENKNDQRYRYYGGRGISVHPSWHKFVNFLSYLQSTIGLRPSPKHSIDRINNDGSYVPGNIRWATKQEQNRNRRQWRAVSCQ